jgi:hypothetical protein
MAVMVLAGLAGLVNLLAFRHAWAMLNFAKSGKQTDPPEVLSLGQKLKILLSGVNIPKPHNDVVPASLGLPFETHQFWVNDRIKLEAWFIPHAHSNGIILMFHGYASVKSTLLPEAQVLHELGYSTFLVDLRGSGGSSGYQTGLGWLENEDVTKAVAYVRLMASGQKVILFGRSMGGAAVLRALYAHQVQADGLIIEAIFDNILSTVQNRFKAMGLPSFPAAHLLIFWGSVYLGVVGFRHNPLEYAAAVRCPALLLHGVNDPRATLSQAKAVFEKLGGPRYWEEFAGVGHESYLKFNPDQWKGAVSQFLVYLDGTEVKQQ